MKKYPCASKGLSRSGGLSVVATLTLVFISPLLHGQVPSTIASCAALENDIARLQCYDALAESVGPSPDPGAPGSGSDASTTGNWIVMDETNPIDDTRTVVVALPSASGTSSRGTPIALILMCQSGDTSLIIKWDAVLTRYINWADVLTRIGTDEASTRRWSLSTDRQATLVPGNNVEFIQRLLTADRLLAQVAPANESPITAVFDLAGIEDALAPLRQTCGW